MKFTDESRSKMESILKASKRLRNVLPGASSESFIGMGRIAQPKELCRWMRKVKKFEPLTVSMNVKSTDYYFTVDCLPGGDCNQVYPIYTFTNPWTKREVLRFWMNFDGACMLVCFGGSYVNRIPYATDNEVINWIEGFLSEKSI